MRKGFTLLELIVVFGIMIALGAVVFGTLASRRSDADITAATQQIATLLRQAQSDAIAQENSPTQGTSTVAWGVHFSNSTSVVPSYALFAGASYSTTNTISYYPLPLTVAYQTSTLAQGATLDIIFSPITGAASVSTSIKFYMPKQSTAFSSTISVASSGEIGY